jgi:hypothetical protein
LVDQERNHGSSKYCEKEYFILYSGRQKGGLILACNPEIPTAGRETGRS